jgi:glutaminyl-tRNA synthetase
LLFKKEYFSMGISEEKLAGDLQDQEPKNFIHQIIEEDIRTGKYEGRVQTRFPPEPNGYLHIGHAKSICLNFGTASKYNGKCNLRFDDTNPVKEDTEYVDSIKEDIHWLGFDWEGREYYASAYFETLYEYAVKLIKKGKAYVCDLTQEQMGAIAERSRNPGKTVLSATVPWKKTCGFWNRCVPAISPTDRRYCGQKLIWPIPIC